MSTNFYELLTTNDYIVDRDLGKYKKKMAISIRACSGYIILVKKYFHWVPSAWIDDNKITAGGRFVFKEHFFFCA